MPTAARPALRAALAAMVISSTIGVAALAAPASADVAQGAPVVSAPTAPPDTLPEPNVYIPEDRDLSDCLSSLPKPDCGSEDRGGAAQYITFAVLMLGMAFIGWRIFLGVRRRDRAQTPTS